MNNLQQTLSSIAAAHNKTPAQIALNWLISKQNVVAIPGTKTSEQIANSAGSAGWRLTENEGRKLESAASEMKVDTVSGIPNLLRAVIHEIIPTKQSA
jgi:diketogulonate reductase-like aldo/keto reductase